jgi:hypothetical protein
VPRLWFRIAFAKNAFLRLLQSKGTTLDELDVATAVTLMTEFHEHHGAQHTSHGGVDELRVEYGTHRSTVTITRHMVRTDPDLARNLVLCIAEQNTLELRDA